MEKHRLLAVTTITGRTFVVNKEITALDTSIAKYFVKEIVRGQYGVTISLINNVDSGDRLSKDYEEAINELAPVLTISIQWNAVEFTVRGHS